MKQSVLTIREELFARYPRLTICRADLDAAFARLVRCYREGGMLLVCGNGGSAADAEHITGELMKGFRLARPAGEKIRREIGRRFPADAQTLGGHLQGALPAIPLGSHTALATAYANDAAADMVFAQQVYGYYRPANVAMGISTSGRSRNVVLAMKTAAALGNGTLALTGEDGGELAGICDAVIRVPERETYRVQELHLPVYHALCAMLEAEFFTPGAMESVQNTTY